MKKPDSEFESYIDQYLGALDVMENTQRMTGRTTRMIQQVRNGDLVIVPNLATGDIFKRQLSENGVDNVRFYSANSGGDIVASLLNTPSFRGKKYNNLHIDHFVAYMIAKQELGRARKVKSYLSTYLTTRGDI